MLSRIRLCHTEQAARRAVRWTCARCGETSSLAEAVCACGDKRPGDCLSIALQWACEQCKEGPFAFDAPCTGCGKAMPALPPAPEVCFCIPFLVP